jgi:hypothetical protein
MFVHLYENTGLMARKKQQKKQDKSNQADVHEDLKGLEININPFGEIETNYDIQKINNFLNEHVDDKKLKEREELQRKGLSKDQENDIQDSDNAEQSESSENPSPEDKDGTEGEDEKNDEEDLY